MEIKKVLTLAFIILVGNNADCFTSYSSYDTMSNSDISLDSKYINNNYINVTNNYIKVDTINTQNNIMANNALSTSTILIKDNKINNSAIGELAEMVYNDDIHYFAAEDNPRLLNIRSLLKQNDFSNMAVTNYDVEEFMKIIKSLNTKQIRNISMLYRQMYESNSAITFSTDVSYLYSLLQYYKDPENVIDDNRHCSVYNEIDLFFINYFLKNYTIPELIRVQDKKDLQFFLTSHGYDEYYRRIVVPQTNKYYMTRINNTKNIALQCQYAEDLTNTLKELDSSNIEVDTWNYEIKDVYDITLPTLKKFILLVNEIHKAKPDLVKVDQPILIMKSDNTAVENINAAPLLMKKEEVIQTNTTKILEKLDKLDIDTLKQIKKILDNKIEFKNLIAKL